MSTCPTCRADLPDGARFCPACGARVADERSEATERKTVTTLFADLVGFTALGERHDPEDVDAALRGYYALARTIVERFGGVVEKFIGDAVVGLFGVPAAHEDDAERAVRAALELVAHMHELPSIGDERLRVRCAVNTGPALVRLGARPEAGEGVLVGDAVNTAARLLAEAPAMGVVVGDMTQRLSSRVIAYEAMPPRHAKGKDKPIKRWVVRGPVAQRGPEAGTTPSPMVGREVELAVLLGLLDRAVASNAPQYVLIEGEAGLGKTRLVREMFRAVDERPGFFCTWRQGRCPSYGDGLAFWALGEIVAAHAGILQSDGLEAAERKLETALCGEERDEWLLTRLRPLVGLPGAQTDRDDSFAAWLQFLVGLARTRPTVVVFEDVHWASEATLAFLRYVVESATDAPLVVVATARPEFRAAHPHVAGYTTVTTLQLRALTPPESARLAAAVPGAQDRPSFVDLAVLRCGGNPLFTQEFMRFVAECAGEMGDPSATQSEAQVPDSLQALISARLDALPPDERTLLSDAAVVGQVFWPGALEALGGRDRAVEDTGCIADLESREMIRVNVSSSLAGERELAFWHGLIRDVAYERLPRRDRAGKHAAVARWMDAFAEARTNLAELRAYHFATAHDLAVSTHQKDLAEEVRVPTMSAHKDAGDHLLSVDVDAAAGHYQRAQSLARDGDVLRPQLEVSLAEAEMRAGRLDAAVQLFRRGIEGLCATDDQRAAAVAMTHLSTALHWQDLNQDPEAQELQNDALRLLENVGPSPELVTVLEERAVHCVHQYNSQESAIRFADEALDLSASLGLPVPVRALAYKGMARCELGDADGLGDLRLAQRLADERGDSLAADSACQMLASAIYPFEGPRSAQEIARSGLDRATRRGMKLTATWFETSLVESARLAGDWAGALRHASHAEGMATDPVDLIDLRIHVAVIRMQQGELQTARELMEWCTGQAPSDVYTQVVKLEMDAAFACRSNESERARGSLVALEQLTRGRRSIGALATMLPLVVRTAASADALDALRLIAPTLSDHRPLERCAALSLSAFEKERAGDFAAAADRHRESASAWGAFGDKFEEALAHLDAGRCLRLCGEWQLARSELAIAHPVLRTLGAVPYQREIERLRGEIAHLRGASA